MKNVCTFRVEDTGNKEPNMLYSIHSTKLTVNFRYYYEIKNTRMYAVRGI